MQSDKFKLRKPACCVNQNKLKLRHLVQISARNLTHKSLEKYRSHESQFMLPKMDLLASKTDLFYYTLHVTPMSSTFYTSEALPGPNVDWPDVELHKIAEVTTTCIPGVVVRVWLKAAQPQLVFTWGVYFRSLTYLGDQLSKDSQHLEPNSLIFGFASGFFTARSSILSSFSPQLPKKLPNTDVYKSYTVKNFCRLHCTQRLVHKQGTEADRLRSEINALDTKLPTSHLRGSGARGRSLLALENASKANIDRKYYRELSVSRETAQFRVSLLRQEKLQQEKQLLQLKQTLNQSKTQNESQRQEMRGKQLNFRQEKERLVEIIRSATDTKLKLIHTLNQLMYRRKQLIAELSFIYPINQNADGSFSIAGVRLPNSEDFMGQDEASLSVALCYVAHVTQMLCYFLQVPLLYPIVQCGSRSRIVDQVTRKLHDQDREFPLFSKGKDKTHFHYGVYLLNKNVAQLRWHCGLSTQDLPATLPNLSALLHLRFLNDESSGLMKGGSQRRLSNDSQNTLLAIPDFVDYEAKPKYHPVNPKEIKGHRVTRSLGGSEASLHSMLRHSFQSLSHPVQCHSGPRGSSGSLETRRVRSSADGLANLMMMDKPASGSPKEREDQIYLPPVLSVLHAASLPLLKSPAFSTKSVSLDRGLDYHVKEESFRKMGDIRNNSFPQISWDDPIPNVPPVSSETICLPRLLQNSHYSQEELLWLAEPTLMSPELKVKSVSSCAPKTPDVFLPNDDKVLEDNGEKVEDGEETEVNELVVMTENGEADRCKEKRDEADRRENIVEQMSEKSDVTAASLDDLFSSMTLRTEALANSASSFKLSRARPPV